MKSGSRGYISPTYMGVLIMATPEASLIYRMYTPSLLKGIFTEIRFPAGMSEDFLFVLSIKILSNVF